MSHVIVDAGAYKMVLNILRRNAERLNQPSLAEAADALQDGAYVLPREEFEIGEYSRFLNRLHRPVVTSQGEAK